MALQKKYIKIAFGKELYFDQAYIQVKSLFGDKNFIEFQISIFDDNKKGNLLDTKLYSFTPSILDDSYNFYKQIYLYLKSLDEFSESIDVLEDGQTP